MTIGFSINRKSIRQLDSARCRHRFRCSRCCCCCCCCCYSGVNPMLR